MLHRWLPFQGVFWHLKWVQGRDPESRSDRLCSDEGTTGGPDLSLQGAKGAYRSRRVKKTCLPTDALREASKLYLLAAGGPAGETFASWGPGPRDPWIPSGIDFRRMSRLKRLVFVKKYRFSLDASSNSTTFACVITSPGGLLSRASVEGLEITDLGAQHRAPERFWLPNR